MPIPAEDPRPASRGLSAVARYGIIAAGLVVGLVATAIVLRLMDHSDTSRHEARRASDVATHDEPVDRSPAPTEPGTPTPTSVPSSAPAPSSAPQGQSAPPPPSRQAPAPGPAASHLDDPVLKKRAAQITSTFENSTTELQYDYAEDIGDGNGITAGRAGFCSGTNDLLRVVERYTSLKPDNVLADYLPTLRKVDGSSSTKGLEDFPRDWKKANRDPLLHKVQDEMVDKLYFNPAMREARAVGVTTPLGQAIVWDTYIQHGEGDNIGTAQIIRETRAKVGEATGNETEWLRTFLDVRYKKLLKMYDASEKKSSQSRVAAWKSLIDAGRLQLQTPLRWKAYGETFTLTG